MVQVIDSGQERPSTGSLLARGLGQIGKGSLQGYEQHQLRQAMKQLGLPENIPPELAKTMLAERMKGQSKLEQVKEKARMLGLDDMGQGSMGDSLRSGGESPEGQGQQQGQQGMDPTQLTDDYIAKVALIDPNVARSLQHAKDVAQREKSSAETRALQQKKFEATEKERERAHQTSYSKKAEEAANAMRTSLPKKEMALDFARNAVETGDMGYFSPDKLAEATGIDLFRTAKGAQLVTAGKENLLSNLSRVSSKGQNLWFEQRLNSMFPKIGQSKEANLTVQEMLEAENQMDKAYLSNFDRLSQEDEAQHGFVRKDIEKRARDAVKPIEKDIMKRTTYRMKEIEEQEHGLKTLQSKVGKNVIKGTPLTLAMAKLYKEKFGDNALDVAEKNGYYIPTVEEFQAFHAQPSEFREAISQ